MNTDQLGSIMATQTTEKPEAEVIAEILQSIKERRP
jgi:hypothetical protein